ncbi:MFS transporter [Deinococcus aquiradiocola]|uniref:MFS transporter n=2 Tax=Deinococcus aquiradiocola TaxID=393059 RepID=A0A917PIW9_9DEIO|nr:MFS transporter [Deinococcus aquiradiocola]
MVSSQLVTQTAFTLGLPFLPLYIQSLGVRDPQTAALWAGASATASGVAMAVMAPVWGRLADRFGAKAMVLRATFGGVVVVGAMGLVGGPVPLLLLRLLQGLLTGTVSASNTLVASTIPERRLGFGMGLMQTAVFAGAAGGPLIGGFIADALGFRVPFAVTAALLLVSGVMVALFTHERRPAPREAGVHVPRVRARMLWGALAPIVVVNFLDQLANSVVGPVLPLVIADLSGPGGPGLATATGTILGSVAVSASVGALLAGRLSDRLPARTVLAVCAGGAALSAGLQGLAGSVLVLGVLRVVMGVFIGGTIPAANAILGSVVRREDRGVAFGLTASAASFGFALGPLLGALLVHLDIRAPFFLTGVLMAVECVWVLLALRGLRPHPADPEGEA